MMKTKIGVNTVLFENDYKTVFLETEWNEELIRKRNREERVPESVIENMLSRLVLPERFESEKVLWKVI